MNDFYYINSVLTCECYSIDTIFNTFKIKGDLYLVYTAKEYHHHHYHHHHYQEMLPVRCCFITGPTRKMDP